MLELGIVSHPRPLLSIPLKSPFRNNAHTCALRILRNQSITCQQEEATGTMSTETVDTFLKNTAFMAEFIAHVQTFPCLYDKDYEESRSRFSRQQAWLQISDRIGPNILTAAQCRALWTKLRIGYTVHLRHLSRGRTSRFKLAKPLEFLGQFVDIQLKKPVSCKVVDGDGSGEEDDPPGLEGGVTEEDCLIEYCPEEDGVEEVAGGVQNIADQTIVVYVLFPDATC